MTSEINSAFTPTPITPIEAKTRYGEIRSGIWADEAKHCQLLNLPVGLQIPYWINALTGKMVTHIYCNKDFIPHLLAALSNVVNAGLAHDLETFDGCFEIRDIRAIPGTISCHSYGMAIDINASKNQLWHATTFSPAFIACWTRAGFIWGGNFKRTDPMHFTLGW